MMYCELELIYEKYVDECKAKGIAPKDIATWWDELE